MQNSDSQLVSLMKAALANGGTASTVSNLNPNSIKEILFSRALSPDDNGAILFVKGSLTITVPAGLPKNFSATIVQVSAGAVQLVPEGPVSINGIAGFISWSKPFIEVNLLMVGETDTYYALNVPDFKITQGSFSFDGVRQGIDISPIVVNEFQDFTFMWVMKFTDDIIDKQDTILAETIERGPNRDQDNFGFNNQRLHCFHDGSNQVTSNLFCTTGNTYYFAVVREGSTWRIFSAVNAEDYSLDQEEPNKTTASFSFSCIGFHPTLSPARYFQGFLQELRYFNTALNLEQLKAIQRNPLADPQNISCLHRYYKLNDLTNTHKVLDFSQFSAEGQARTPITAGEELISANPVIFKCEGEDVTRNEFSMIFNGKQGVEITPYVVGDDQDFTFSWVVRFTDDPINKQDTILAEITQRLNVEQDNFGFNNGKLHCFSNRLNQIISNVICKPGVVYFFAVTREGSTWRIFVAEDNGDLRLDQEAPNASTFGFIWSRIGYHPTVEPPRFLTGQLQEVRFFTRALSFGELAGIYKNPIDPDPADQSLTRYYKLNDSPSNDNTTIRDHSIFNLDGIAEAPLELGETMILEDGVEYPGIIIQPDPVAEFRFDPRTGNTPLTVNFDAGASYLTGGNIIRYTWDFGDGNVGEGMVIQHTYVNPGEYVVVLTVFDEKGRQDNRNRKLAIPENGDPIAQFTADKLSGEVSFRVNFNASESFDPDGNISNYVWDFGDGSVGEGMVTAHTFTSEGTFKVILTVTDNQGATDTFSQNIRVESQNTDFKGPYPFVQGPARDAGVFNRFIETGDPIYKPTPILVNTLRDRQNGLTKTSLGQGEVWVGGIGDAWSPNSLTKVPLIMPIVSGKCRMEFDYEIRNKEGFAYFGECAPSPGIWFTNNQLELRNIQNFILSHLISIPGSDSGHTADAITLIKCRNGKIVESLFAEGGDETFDITGEIDSNGYSENIEVVRCAIVSPGGPQRLVLVDWSYGIVFGECVFIHSKTRMPLIRSREAYLYNNLFYNRRQRFTYMNLEVTSGDSRAETRRANYQHMKGVLEYNVYKEGSDFNGIAKHVLHLEDPYAPLTEFYTFGNIWLERDGRAKYAGPGPNGTPESEFDKIAESGFSRLKSNRNPLSSYGIKPQTTSVDVMVRNVVGPYARTSERDNFRGYYLQSFLDDFARGTGSLGSMKRIRGVDIPYRETPAEKLRDFPGTDSPEAFYRWLGKFHK